jgi:hypothetical protein
MIKWTFVLLEWNYQLIVDDIVFHDFQKENHHFSPMFSEHFSWELVCTSPKSKSSKCRSLKFDDVTFDDLPFRRSSISKMALWTKCISIIIVFRHPHLNERNYQQHSKRYLFFLTINKLHDLSIDPFNQKSNSMWKESKKVSPIKFDHRKKPVNAI